MKWNRRLVCVFVFVGSIGYFLAAPRAISDSKSVAHHHGNARHSQPLALPMQAVPANLIRAENPLKNATVSTSSQPDDKTLDLPLAFEPNAGQTDPRVKFIARGRGVTVFLTRDEMMLQMPRRPESAAHSSSRVRADKLTPETAVVTMRWHQQSARTASL